MPFISNFKYESKYELGPCESCIAQLPVFLSVSNNDRSMHSLPDNETSLTSWLCATIPFVPATFASNDPVFVYGAGLKNYLKSGNLNVPYAELLPYVVPNVFHASGKIADGMSRPSGYTQPSKSNALTFIVSNVGTAKNLNWPM